MGQDPGRGRAGGRYAETAKAEAQAERGRPGKHRSRVEEKVGGKKGAGEGEAGRCQEGGCEEDGCQEDGCQEDNDHRTGC